jgi:uncharacterized protein YcaQ
MTRLEVERASLRRLAVRRQGLSGPRFDAGANGILELIRSMGYVQIDPMRVVERSHRLVLWSRLGPYDPAALHELRWLDRSLFEYWAHAHSLVLTENLPIHRHQMAAFGKRESVPAKRQRRWMAENKSLHDTILDQLGHRDEPVAPTEIGASPARSWRSKGWTDGRGVRHMLELMWRHGEVVIAGRDGRGKLYALPEYWFADAWEDASRPMSHVRKRIAEISVRALGAGTARHIQLHFISGLDPNLPETLQAMVDDGTLVELSVVGDSGRRATWYTHAEDEASLRAVADGEFEGRTTLLSPFDNLICDRRRTRQLWDFDYRSEIYVPKQMREYGHYVMPILDGEELVGRIDPQMDRERASLEIHAVHAEPGRNRDPAIGRRLGEALASLAEFLGAERLELSRRVPTAWRRGIRDEIG